MFSGVSEQLRHKTDCVAAGDRYRLEISDLVESTEILLFTDYHAAVSALLFSHMQTKSFLMMRLNWCHLVCSLFGPWLHYGILLTLASS